MKIVGVDNYTNMTLEEIEDDINIRNFNESHEKCKVLHINFIKRTNQSSIIIEVLYKMISDNKNRVFIGHQSCKVWDLINIKPCLKCGRFGHSTLKCINPHCCLKCAGSHITIKCDNNAENKCINCLYSNNKYKTNLQINHMANDTEKCSILKKKIERYIDMTDYPISPTVPRFVGNVENYKEDNSKTKRPNIQSESSADSADVTPKQIPNQRNQRTRNGTTHRHH